ncbi:MAG: tetratricopeptide repeat protein [Deltaproteobacteria bacterium]|nr:tetratricopeptide repeat protein [Deltaproteobacteria bacterium]
MIRSLDSCSWRGFRILALAACALASGIFPGCSKRPEAATEAGPGATAPAAPDYGVSIGAPTLAAPEGQATAALPGAGGAQAAAVSATPAAATATASIPTATSANATGQASPPPVPLAPPGLIAPPVVAAAAPSPCVAPPFREGDSLLPPIPVAQLTAGNRDAAQDLIVEARRYGDADNWSMAFDRYRAATLADPSDPRGYGGMGYAYGKLGRPQDAIAPLLTGLGLDPRSELLWRRLGDMYADMRDWDRAIEAYDRALEILPMGEAALLAKGDMYWEMRQPELARAVWQCGCDAGANLMCRRLDAHQP